MTTQAESPEAVVISTVMGDMVAGAETRASAFGGGTVSADVGRRPDEVKRDLGEWYPDLFPALKEVGGASDALGGFVPQVGPLNTGPITFGGGTPVGGFSQLTLFQSGQFNFNGHFHVSGAPSYNVAYAVGVRSQLGVLYTFLRSGHLAGTFEPGSRDYDWSVQELRDVIREDWPNLAVNSTWWWNARVNWDPLALLGTIKTLAETVGAVGAVVALL
jgi:hypothetical protein